jgi:site-specific recombinase XerD
VAGACWLEIPAAQTKTRIPIALPFPEPLVPALEAYLAHWRPRLAPPGQAGPPCPALWLTEQNRGISATHAHLRITRHTRAAFGRSVNPHGFRDALATTVAIDSPELIGIVTPLLGHGVAPLQPRLRHGSRHRLARHPRQHRRELKHLHRVWLSQGADTCPSPIRC